MSQVTEHIGGLPGAPQSVVLGQYRSADSLSLSYSKPQYDGGLAITTYVVEVDTSPAFDVKNEDYSSTYHSIVPEVQEITISFRAGDNVKRRGGTFTLSFGGRTTADLAFDISAYDLEIALNLLVRTRQVAFAPVSVVRHAFNRGYKWTISFIGIHGDVGSLLIDYSLLVGDDPRMDIVEITKGNCDIVPGLYTYEVQTIHTSALSPIDGWFRLNFEGYDTELMRVNETAESFKQKLESLHTIYTVNVDRESINDEFELYAWKVTFTHMRNERVQGAGNLPPMTVEYELTPASSASVNVFEDIKGSSPTRITLGPLRKAQMYYARVTAYNNRGFSLTSAVTSAYTLGQPPAPESAALSIVSSSSLSVAWTDSNSAAYNVDGYLVEVYSSVPKYEVQVITTSSSASLDEIQRITIESDKDNLAGYFKLEFMGEVTENIMWNANAEGADSVALALAKLQTIGEVEVTRQLSRRIVQGLRVSVTSGSYTATVDTGSTSSLSKGDLIWISNLPFYVVSTTSTTIELGYQNSTTVRNFNEETIENAKVYKWSYGYTWDVTFISQLGDMDTIIPYTSDNWAGTNPIVKVDVIRQGVAPLSGTFRVRFMGDSTPQLPCDISAADMEAAIEQLSTVGDVTVERFRNGFGFDWRVTFVTELWNLPLMYVNDASLAGPFAKAGVSRAQRGVVPDNYHQVFVSGGNLRSKLLPDLTMGLAYQVRVRAHNDEGYSAAVVANPLFLAPKTAPTVPFNATMFALSSSRLKVVWMAPLSNGGAPIVRYRVEWDIDSSFKNIKASGNSAEIPVSPSDGPSFCYDIDIVASSSNVPRYARISAYNGYQWSALGYPSPRSAKGEINAPGAPVAVTAYSTSDVGIMVVWDAPNSDACEYGGNGGTPVTHYVVEWDLRDDFNSPAEFVTLYDLVDLQYEIGGRNVLTGKESSVLSPGREYFIRVTAFNSKGAGVAGYAFIDTPVGWKDSAGDGCDVYANLPDARFGECVTGATCGCGAADNKNWIGELSYGKSADEACCACKSVCGITTEDILPSSPENITLRVVDGTSLLASWDNPIRDGGVTIESYRLMHSTDPTFEFYDVTTLPVVSEVQTIVAASDLENEVQAIRMITEVTNERQIIRTTVAAKDEIQTITTHCDKVTNEIQRITTTASDVNELQTLEIVGTDVDEVQVITLDNENFPEIQTVEISTPRVNEVQIFGLILENVDTSTCTVGSYCDAVESQITGSFKLQFVPADCGTDTDNSDTNWCTIALDDADVTGYDCSDSSCMTDALTMDDNVTVIQTELCNLKGSGSTTFMTDGDGKCVHLDYFGITLESDATNGVYMYAYNVTFESDYLRGNVPALQIYHSTVQYNDIRSSPPTVGYLTEYGNHHVGDISIMSSRSEAYTIIEGSQPDGVFFLNYECEARTVPVNVDVTNLGKTITLSEPVVQLFQYIRIHKTYHQIVNMSSDYVGEISPAFASNTYSTDDAEVGFFYSDPEEFDGVSEACNVNRITPTVSIDCTASEEEVVTKIRGLADIINDEDGSILVTRSYYASDESRVGYIWTITFVKQNGDLKPLTCNSTDLTSTTVAGDVDCLVHTLRNGSLVDGSFVLNITTPNYYEGVVQSNESVSMPWNIRASNMAEVLSALHGPFGDVAVTRSVYTKDTYGRWTGGYIWTVSFVSRNGDIPEMEVISTLSNTSSIEVTTAIEGNQVTGSFGLTFVDVNGTETSSESDAFPIVSPYTGTALNATEFEHILSTMFDGQDLFDVTRSETPNAVMGYTYTIEFTGQSMGGDVNMFVVDTTNLDKTAVASDDLKVGELCSDAAMDCNVGTYVVNYDIEVKENRKGAMIQGAFQVTFNGYTTGALPYNADAIQLESELNTLASIYPSKVTVTRDGPMTTPFTQVFGYVVNYICLQQMGGSYRCSWS